MTMDIRPKLAKPMDLQEYADAEWAKEQQALGGESISAEQFMDEYCKTLSPAVAEYLIRTAGPIVWKFAEAFREASEKNLRSERDQFEKLFEDAHRRITKAEAEVGELRQELARWRALDKHLPQFYAIGDDATATLAVELTETEEILNRVKAKNEELESEVEELKRALRATGIGNEG
jgi:hypothetical protein